MLRANPVSIVCLRSSRQCIARLIRLRSTLHPPPGSGVLLLGFGAWSIACDKLQAAPNALKVMGAKNFSKPANFGIMTEVSEII
jgi:hypothetical protein